MEEKGEVKPFFFFFSDGVKVGKGLKVYGSRTEVILEGSEEYMNGEEPLTGEFQELSRLSKNGLQTSLSQFRVRQIQSSWRQKDLSFYLFGWE